MKSLTVFLIVFSEKCKNITNEIKTIKTEIKEKTLQTDLKGAKKDNTGADVTNQIRSIQAETDKKLEEGPVIKRSNRKRA